MRNIQRVLKVYLDADTYFQAKESKARKPLSRQQWSDKRDKNDQAYFLLLFAQLEDYVNNLCRKLIAKKHAAKNWKLKRLWNNIKINNIQQQISFMQRVALLTDKNPKSGLNIYSEISKLYDARCQIAHKGDYGPISIPREAKRMYELAKQLQG